MKNRAGSTTNGPSVRIGRCDGPVRKPRVTMEKPSIAHRFRDRNVYPQDEEERGVAL